MKDIHAINVHVTGLVQGVGFRPFVFRIAARHGITGWVENGNDGVRIHAEGRKNDLAGFITGIRAECPPAAQIRDVIADEAPAAGFRDFRIRTSSDHSSSITEISPDIAVCPECLADMKAQPHRLDYPFINCTNCGPRFSIISDLPYDRPKTTMEPFVMCDACRAEYTDVADRRFHAQPVACSSCGPKYQLVARHGIYSDLPGILGQMATMIADGKILAIKGIGGFHLACDALNGTAVSRLRAGKNREGKPFAVMFRSLEEAGEYVQINNEETDLLLSWRRPVVILENKIGGKKLPDGVSNGFGTTGVMLPYMPLHYLLFEQLQTPVIVLTSGNFSDEPIVISNDTATGQFMGISDAVLVYDREIFNRTDDSVVMSINGYGRLIRRSRGYAPAPVHLAFETEGIFAAGAELVNCFCIGKGEQAIMSQHIGDLKNLETLDFYVESYRRFSRMFRAGLSLAACDLHPDYLSTRFALDLASQHDIPVVRVQHHHAHIAACMAEHGLEGKVIGISMDGVGLGTDGNIWGFEGLICNLLDFQRFIHLDYVRQPGGDMATHQPWRMALSYLSRYFGTAMLDEPLDFLKELPRDQVEMVVKALEHGINAPLTSSAGRLFDAVAAMVGVCRNSVFHAEAPMRLENIADWNASGSYRFGISTVIDPEPVIREIVRDLQRKTGPAVISARFHTAVVEAVVDIAKLGHKQYDLKRVVLSGGSFQNRYLLAKAEIRLRESGFEVYSPLMFPANDGGIALGQMAVAACKRKLGLV